MARRPLATVPMLRRSLLPEAMTAEDAAILALSAKRLDGTSTEMRSPLCAPLTSPLSAIVAPLAVSIWARKLIGSPAPDTCGTNSPAGISAASPLTPVAPGRRRRTHPSPFGPMRITSSSTALPAATGSDDWTCLCSG